MTSYKNVEKFEYKQNPDDVVALREYILFDDGKTGEKYAVLKFVNNLDQKLYAVEFETKQYDASGSLLAKSLSVYDGFTADSGETFVPKAKLRLVANCAEIAVKLVSARFDRVRFEKGDFTDNSYSFKRFIVDEHRVGTTPATARAATSAPSSASAPSKGTKKKQSEKPSPEFIATNVYGENYTKLPQVLAVLIFIAVMAFVIAMAFYTRNSSKEFSIGEWDVVLESDSEISIVGYDGKAKDVEIPATLDGYTVVRIGKNAFRGSKITSVTFDASKMNITVAAYAFDGCKQLTEVRSVGSNTVLVNGYGFNECSAITRIDMPNGRAFEHSFYGSNNVDKFIIGNAPEKDKVVGR